MEDDACGNIKGARKLLACAEGLRKLNFGFVAYRTSSNNRILVFVTNGMEEEVVVEGAQDLARCLDLSG